MSTVIGQSWIVSAKHFVGRNFCGKLSGVFVFDFRTNTFLQLGLVKPL